MGGVKLEDASHDGYYFPAQCIQKVDPPKKEVKLNDEHKAIIHSNGNVEVGCQIFTKTAIKRFIKVYNEAQIDCFIDGYLMGMNSNK